LVIARGWPPAKRTVFSSPDQSSKFLVTINSSSPTVVVVMDRNAKEKPGFSRIYRPADLYLNGECTDDDGYYLEQHNLVPL
jgi:hypothetical protein